MLTFISFQSYKIIDLEKTVRLLYDYNPFSKYKYGIIITAHFGFEPTYFGSKVEEVTIQS
jgi:hypothetical protein